MLFFALRFRGEIWPKPSEKNNKNYQDEDKKSAIKLILRICWHLIWRAFKRWYVAISWSIAIKITCLHTLSFLIWVNQLLLLSKYQQTCNIKNLANICTPLHNLNTLLRRKNYLCQLLFKSSSRTILSSIQWLGYTVVYWTSTRPNMPFQGRGSCIFHWCRRAWLTIWGKVKSHGTVRLMHRKRVTCEQHYCYFRLTTIKHAIPRTAEVTHPDGQLWGDIEWAIELLYNSVKTGSKLVWRPDRWWQDVVEKAITQQKAGPPGLRLSSPRERERNTVMANRVRVSMLQFCLVSDSLSHTNLSNKVRGLFF